MHICHVEITYRLPLQIGQHRCIPCSKEVVRARIDRAGFCDGNCRLRLAGHFRCDMQPETFRTANWWNLACYRRHVAAQSLRLCPAPLNYTPEHPKPHYPNCSVRTNGQPLNKEKKEKTIWGSFIHSEWNTCIPHFGHLPENWNRGFRDTIGVLPLLPAKSK